MNSNYENIKNKVIVMFFIILFLLFYMKMKENLKQERFVKINSSTESVIKTKDSVGKINIQIGGCVKNPTSMYLKNGSVLLDAVNEAGGFTEDADRLGVDLAKVLVDGERYFIPRKKEEIVIPDGKVNINIATKEELMKIDGIGEKMAERIIRYREENGNFFHVEELKFVYGIGDAKFELIKKYVVC